MTTSNPMAVLWAGLTWSLGYICLALDAVGVFPAKSRPSSHAAIYLAHSRAGWPLVFGAWSLAWETEFTRRAMSKKQYSSAFVFCTWALADATISCILIIYGQGRDDQAGPIMMDELNLFAMRTRADRALGFATYFCFWTIVLRIGCCLDETFVKYQSFFGLHMLVWAQLRLPAFQTPNYLLLCYLVLTFVSHVLWAHKFFQKDLSPVVRLYIFLLPTLNIATFFTAHSIQALSAREFASLSGGLFFASYLPVLLPAPVVIDNVVVNWTTKPGMMTGVAQRVGNRVGIIGRGARA